MGYSKKPGDKPKNIKGTVFESIISSDPPCKMAIPDLQRGINYELYLKN